MDRHHGQQCNRCGVRLACDNPDQRCAACQRAGRDQLLSPPAVPAEFWEYPAVRGALASRHMGQVIRAFRLHPLHGRDIISQRTVAEWVGLTQAQLSRIEGGSPMVHLDRLIQWACLLRIPEAYLWFKLPEQPSPVIPKLETAERDREEDVDVKRQDFLRFGGLGVAGMVAPGLLKAQPTGVVTERDCAQWLAWELWHHQEAALHVTDLPLSIARYLGLVDSTGQSATQLSSISPDGLILCDQHGYCSLSHPALIDFYVAQHVFRSITDGQSQLLATAQTSHAMDCVLQEFVRRHELSTALLTDWMHHGANAVLRVNSAGILAKLGEPTIADTVVTTLKADQDNRQRYLTAVASRVLSLEWQTAAQLVTTVEQRSAAAGLVSVTATQVAELSAELVNPRDGAARWCSTVLLGSVDEVLPDIARAALGKALRDEPCRENLRAIGTVLAGGQPLDT
ncbi:MAG: helix-turn-helix domain-containing protein [Actinomycetota bacterium]|nr:helix-turn-helix domain-containing protein [Actinomycetota bacterium]